MTLRWRLIFIILSGAVLASLSFAIYIMLAPKENATKPEFSALQNFIASREPKELKPITFLDQNGKTVSLSDFEGRIIVLNLWATWCTPCVAELPMLDRLQQQVANLNVLVLALSIDRGGPAAVKEFYAHQGIRNLPIFVDPTMRSQSDLTVIGLPTTIIIDKDGYERGRLVGAANWDDASAVELILKATAD